MQQKTLPASWVDKLFLRLMGVYGREFTGQFSQFDAEGNDIGLLNAKQVWAEELGGFADHPEAMAYALKNLPERCPNAIRFRDLCRHAPPKNVLQLDHKLSDEQIESNKAKAKELLDMLARNKSMG